MPAAEGGPKTLYDKVFQAHVVDERLDGTVLLYIGPFEELILFSGYPYLHSQQTDIWFMKSHHLYACRHISWCMM